MSQNNKPAQAGKNGPGFTKLEEASLRILQACLSNGSVLDFDGIKVTVETADKLLKATNHFANNGSFDTFEE